MKQPELKSIGGIVGKWCPYNARILCNQSICQGEDCSIYQEWVEFSDHDEVNRDRGLF